MGTDEIKQQLVALRYKTYQQFLQWKRIDYQLKTVECLVAWRHANASDRKILYDLVENVNANGVKAWIQTHSQADMQHWSYRKLRDRAKLLNIPRWSRLDRQELISIITQQEKKQNARRDEANRDSASGCIAASKKDNIDGASIQDADGRYFTNQT